MIEHIKSRFRTHDGMEHPTWNAARKHMTGLELAETIRSAGPDLSNEQLIRLAEAVLKSWYISRKKKNET